MKPQHVCSTDKEKLTGVSWWRDVISKYKPARVPPPTSVWRQHPVDPPFTPLTSDLLMTHSTIFPKLTFSLLLPHTPSLHCSGFRETLAIYRFLNVFQFYYSCFQTCTELCSSVVYSPESVNANVRVRCSADSTDFFQIQKKSMCVGGGGGTVENFLK